MSYLDGLAEQLVAAGLPVWYDRGPLTEVRWCVVVVVRTPEADRCEWVFRDIDRAVRGGKPISPLLVRACHSTVATRPRRLASRSFRSSTVARPSPANGRKHSR